MAALIPSGDWWRLHAPGPVQEVKLTCPCCGFVWWVEARQQYGWMEPVDEDAAGCPECEDERC